MLKIITNMLYPFIILLVTPLGITETTPFGEAVTIILLAAVGAVIGWWMSRTPKQD